MYITELYKTQRDRLQKFLVEENEKVKLKRSTYTQGRWILFRAFLMDYGEKTDQMHVYTWIYSDVTSCNLGCINFGDMHSLDL